MTVVWVVNKLLRDGVRAGRGVTRFIQSGINLLVDLGREVGQRSIDGAAESAEIFRFFAGSQSGVENRSDFSVRVGLVVEPFLKVDAKNSVKKEVGGAVFGLPRGADEPDGANWSGAAVGIAAVVPEEVADAKHAISFKGIIDHLPITRLKDMEGHSAVREEHGVGQEDDSAGFGDF